MPWPTTVWPVPKLGDRNPVVTQGFRPTGGSYPHLGVDIMYRRKAGESRTLPTGTKNFYMPAGIPALASADGVVKRAIIGAKHGGQVHIEHRSSPVVKTFYSHLYGLKVKAGQRVKAGQPIGFIGDSPSVNDPRHLHYEVVFSGQGVKGRLDPRKYLAGASMLTHTQRGLLSIALLLSGGYGVYKLLKWRGVM